jgi:tripartite-type tricarboxylate transporter receptor subunit TctC
MRWLAMVMLAGALSAPIANAQDCPTRPVQLIVPFAPGAGSDVVGRLVAQKMTDDFGQPVVVENKSGAGGLLANRYVATSVPQAFVSGEIRKWKEVVSARGIERQ